MERTAPFSVVVKAKQEARVKERALARRSRRKRALERMMREQRWRAGQQSFAADLGWRNKEGAGGMAVVRS